MFLVTFFSYFSCKNTSGVARLQEQSTATYCAVFAESGDLSLGLGDMDIHQQITEKYVGCFNTKKPSHIIEICGPK